MAGKLFVGGLWYETTDETLRSYFESWGAVLDAVVIRDPVSRRSRGFGFVTYADPSSAHLALAQLSHMIDNRRVS
jgi:RNA recognition motif-containing protein